MFEYLSHEQFFRFNLRLECLSRSSVGLWTFPKISGVISRNRSLVLKNRVFFRKAIKSLFPNSGFWEISGTDF